jgi:DNA-binding GntR family transcriptional regulator
LLEGRFVPGQRLVVAELAQRMGFSSIPVRDALHILAGQGVVELLPTRGARIRELPKKELADILTVWSGLCVHNFSSAAARVHEYGDATWKYRLHEHIVQVDEAERRRNAPALFASILAFYETCSEINDNRYFNLMRSHLHVDLYYLHIVNILPGPYWDIYADRLRQLIKCVEAGNSEQVRNVFTTHMEIISAYLRSEIERHFS